MTEELVFNNLNEVNDLRKRVVEGYDMTEAENAAAIAFLRNDRVAARTQKGKKKAAVEVNLNALLDPLLSGGEDDAKA